MKNSPDYPPSTKKPEDFSVREAVKDKLDQTPAEGRIELFWEAKRLNKAGEQEQLYSSQVVLPIEQETSWAKVAELIHRSFKYTADLVSLLVRGEPADAKPKRKKQ